MYAKDFFLQKEHDYSNFFTHYENEKEIKKIKSEFKKIATLLDEKKQEYAEAICKRYNAELTETKYSYELKYTDRSYNDYYFDSLSGSGIVVGCDQNAKIISLPTKKGEFAIVSGYCFPKASLIVKKFKYRIFSDNSQAIITLIGDYIVPIFEENEVHGQINQGTEMKDEILDKKTFLREAVFSHALARIKAEEFVQTFYGIKNHVNFSILDMIEYIKENKSFEIILRTIDDPGLAICLMRFNCDKAVPIHKLLQTDKATWEEAIDKDCAKEFVDFKRKFVFNSIISEKTKFDSTFNKTDHEWIEFIEKVKGWKEDIGFYGIRNHDLDKLLINAYSSNGYPYYKYEFKKFYPFNKFCSYVINETINQGYNSVDKFIETLGDYLEMCKDLEVAPTLYSSYLSQTHDIVSRNHKISLSPTQESVFKSRYVSFKKFTSNNKEYVIVPPTCSYDVRKEGDELNHCVASYIKRIIDGDCIICFLRKTQHPLVPLVTFEIKGRNITQARGLHNRDITPEERKILMEFCVSQNFTLKV